MKTGVKMKIKKLGVKILNIMTTGVNIKIIKTVGKDKDNEKFRDKDNKN